MLPDNDRVVVQVRDICPSDALGVLLHDHPTNVRIKQTFADAIGILLSAKQGVRQDFSLAKSYFFKLLRRRKTQN